MKSHQSSQRPSGFRRWAGAVGAILAILTLTVGGTVAGGDLLPAATAAPCPDGSGNTCGPQPTQDPGPTQGNQGGPTTAPNAPQTTVPPNDAGAPTQPQSSNGTGLQGTVQSMPTADNPNGCIVNCPTVNRPPIATPSPTAPVATAPPTGIPNPTAAITPTVTPGPPSAANSTGPDAPKKDEWDKAVVVKASKCGFRDYLMGGVGIVGGGFGMAAGALTTPLAVGVPVLAGSTVTTAGSLVYVADCIRTRNE